MHNIKSMTGYGSAEASIENLLIKIDIQGVNGKFADIKFRLPKDWYEKESEWRNELTKKINRGTVTVYVKVEEIAGINQKPKALINKEIFNSYTSQLRSLVSGQELDPSHLLPYIITLPGVLLGADEKIFESLNELLDTCLQNAFEQFDQYRITEGKALALQMRENIHQITTRCQLVEALEVERNETLRNKITDQVKIWQERTQIAPERLESEILFYLDKLDITEEKTRLAQHCQYFLECLNDENAGKKLGFICQEIGREINTLGNKANYFPLQKLSVEMKEELEKIKEQVLNIL